MTDAFNSLKSFRHAYAIIGNKNYVSLHKKIVKSQCQVIFLADFSNLEPLCYVLRRILRRLRRRRFILLLQHSILYYSTHASVDVI